MGDRRPMISVLVYCLRWLEARAAEETRILCRSPLPTLDTLLPAPLALRQWLAGVGGGCNTRVRANVPDCAADH